MTKTKSKILLSIFLILVLVSSCCLATVEPTTTGAEVPTEGTTEENNNNQVSTADWVNNDLYIADDIVTIDRVVDGNAFIVGNEVTITGEIGGDLFVVANKLNLEGGYVYSNLFACANEVTISGVVYDAYITCNTFNLASNGFVYRDLKALSNNVNINGKVRRNAFISASNLTFAEGSETLIYGDLNYSSKAEITVPEGAVQGEVKYTAVNIENNKNVGSIILSYVLDLLQTLVFTFVVTLLFIWLTPKFVERATTMSVAKSFASLGIGFATPIVFVIVGILLLISSVGVSIFVSGMFAFILLAFIGTAVASMFFGKLFTKLLKMEGNFKFVLFTLVSALIIWAISQIPFIGGFFGFIISIFGIGTTLVNMVCRTEKPKKEKKEKAPKKEKKAKKAEEKEVKE